MYLQQISNNSIFWTCAISWAIAQVLKFILVLVMHRKVDFTRFTGSGGMPSSHSSFVVSLAASVGLTNGFDSALFAVCTILALVVMYDAAGVRRSAGQQAAILNRLVEDWSKEDYSHTEKKLKELLGHTPVEVIAGAVLGILVAVIRHM